MYKGVIFDFNGTLFEDEDLQAEGWAAVIRKYFRREMPMEEFHEKILGRGNPEILDYLNSLDPEKQYLADGIAEPVSGAALMYGGYVFDALKGDFPSAQIYFRAL